MMAMRAVANLNPELTPLKMTVNATSGELLLEHSSFIDASLTDLKFKRNLVNLTFRVSFILELLMKYRFVLRFYSCGSREALDEGDLPLLKGVKEAD
jgi:hypothetical protein